MRPLALATLALILLFFLLRMAAGHCTGSGCDWFIPASLLIPTATIVLELLTGVRALSATVRRQADRPWALAFALTTMLGVFGPLVSLAILRDSPDTFVSVATAMVMLLPLVALAYSFRRPSGDNRRDGSTSNPA